MPSLTQLEYLVAVDDLRHFGRAAQKCHVSQPTLSMQLQKLEEELDLIVFDRTKKPILPTQRGTQVIEQARVVLKEHRKFLSIGTKKDGEISGDFTLAIIPTLSPSIIPLFLDSFATQYPKVNLKIQEMQTEDIIKALKDDHIDAACLVTPLQEDSLIERVLFYEPFSLYVSDNHPLQKKKAIRDQDLKNIQLWLLSEGHCMRNQMTKICSMRKERSVFDHVSFESGSLETLKNLVKKGKGCTLLPYLAIQDLGKKERDNRVRDFKGKTPSREISIVHSRTFLKEEIINALEATILKLLPKELKSLKNQSLEIIGIN